MGEGKSTMSYDHRTSENPVAIESQLLNQKGKWVHVKVKKKSKGKPKKPATPEALSEPVRRMTRQAGARF